MRRSFVSYAGRQIDFPFQKNIHQLPQAEFIDCLYDLYFARTEGSVSPEPEDNFKQMLYARFGRAIAEKFLIPYNEKLYATDLATLDKDAMGRFFPHADLTDIQPQACLRTVEEVIDEHYRAQSEKLAVLDPALKETVDQFRADEIAHRDTAIAHGAEEATGYAPLTAAIKAGCRLAIKLSERI